MLVATEHGRFVLSDYRSLCKLGITTVREGIRWHVIEQQPHRYNFDQELMLLDAGLEAGIEQIFDLFHFGWPDHLDVFSADFVSSFAELAFRWAGLLSSRGVNRSFVAPCNEISFFSWAGGDRGYLNPFGQGRGEELKRQMVKAGLAAAQVLINELPGVTIVWPEPVIHITGNPSRPGDDEAAERFRLFMFEVWDAISGRVWPELGGRTEFLQVVGVNFYDRNEWVNYGVTLRPTDAEYRPFRKILEEVWNRYHVPIFVSETGTEDDQRPAWLALIAEEVRGAITEGVPVHGICLYPIVNHPGWDDERHCLNGLLDYPDVDGRRSIYAPLAAELFKQQNLFSQLGDEIGMIKQDHFEGDVKSVDMLCFSHLRWDFVFQRPQHLMSRFAESRRVFFIEEPVAGDAPGMNVRTCERSGVHIAVPVLPSNLGDQSQNILEILLRDMMSQNSVTDFVAWYYTPMAMSFTSTLRPIATVYDCMDELSLFRGAPPNLIQNEKALMSRSDLVFTGGYSLFEAKCEQHPRVYAFPSSVDVSHFAQARSIQNEAPDQAHIAHPRIGYAGVIDERMDLELLQQLADMHPDWNLVMLGPIVKIDLKLLPERPNIHYLGMKPYDDLPGYFAGWDVAMLPFALNESTQFISPTKTPEYLAAGLPVVSTPIRDVVRTYGAVGLIRIASTPEEFGQAIEQAFRTGMSMKWRQRADGFLSALSWDKTWTAMNRLIAEVVKDGEAERPRRMAMSGVAKRAEVLGV